MTNKISLLNHQPVLDDEREFFASYAQLSREHRVLDILARLGLGKYDMTRRMRANTMLTQLASRVGGAALSNGISCRLSPFDDSCIMIDFTRSARHVRVELYTNQDAIDDEYEEATIYYVDNGETFWEGNSIARIADRLKALL